VAARSWIAAGTLFAALAALSGKIHHDQAVRAQSLEARLDAMSKQVEQWKSRPASVVQIVTGPERPQPQPSAAELHSSEAGAQLPPPSAPEQDRVDQQHARWRAGLEAEIAAEAVDAGWGTGAAKAIRAVIDQNTSNSRLLEVDCRTSLCRARVRHDSSAAQKQFVDAIADKPPFTFGALYQTEDCNGAPCTVAFVAREGTELTSFLVED